MARPARALAAAAVIVALGAWPIASGCGDDEGTAGPRPAKRAPSGAAQAGPGPERPLLDDGDRVVFIGDSLAVESPPNYPELLPAALGSEARNVVTTNLAEPGTTAADWLPGAPLYEQRLAPELEDADLVAVTLGGNDLEQALGGSDGIDSLSAGESGSEGAFAALDQLERRLKRIYAAIRERAPGARIVFVGYPDYSEASVWREAAGVSGTVALSLGLSALVDAAEGADPDLLVDMREASVRAGVDKLLADTEHLGPAGHELYAKQLAQALTAP